MLRSGVIRDIEVLRQLEPRWREAAAAVGNVFLTPDWYFQHCEAHPSARAAVVVVYGRADDVAALIPLVDDGRTVRFAGAALGDRFGAVVLDREELDPVRVWQQAAPLLRRIADERMVVLDRVDSGVQPRAHGAMTFAESSEVLPYIALRATSWEDWLADRSGNFRSQMKRKQQRLERAGVIRFLEVRDEAEADRALAAHFELHYQRRESVGDQSSLASGAAQVFHAGLVRRLAANGWLRLWLLECDGKPIASWYGWRIGACYAYYQAGFDVSWADYSRGVRRRRGRLRPATRRRAVQAALHNGRASRPDDRDREGDVAVVPRSVWGRGDAACLQTAS